MPQPMPPPQGAPSPDQGPPPGGPPDQQGQGGGLSNLLMSIDKAIDHLAEQVSQDKSAPPEAMQLITVVDQAFGKFMSLVTGSPEEQEGPGGEGQGQTVPPEAGGNKGAIPSPM